MPRVKRAGSLAQFFKDDPSLIAIDTETDGVEFFDEAFYISIAWRNTKGIQSLLLSLPEDKWIAEDCISGKKWVFHHAKFDLQKLILMKVIDPTYARVSRVHDTEAIAHLLDENQKKGLKPLAKKYLGYETTEEVELRRVRRRLKLKKDDGLRRVPSLTVVPYALKDAEYTLELYERIRPLLPDSLVPLYNKEIELSLVLLEMESNGLGVDVDYTRKVVKVHNDRIYNLEYEIAEEVGKPVRTGKIPPKERDQYFNPNYWEDILTALNERGARIDETSAATLEGIDDPLARAILERRKLQKMNSGWLEPVIKHERDGVYHGNHKQHNTATGRLASGTEDYD